LERPKMQYQASKPDLVLIFRKPDESSLQLVRLGSHSQLGI